MNGRVPKFQVVLADLYRGPMKILHVYKDYHPIRGGIENHIRTLAEAQAAREAPAFTELQATMGVGSNDHLCDVLHCAEHRRDVRRRQHVDPFVGARAREQRHQRLRHDGVADPVRGDDQGAHDRLLLRTITEV